VRRLLGLKSQRRAAVRQVVLAGFTLCCLLGPGLLAAADTAADSDLVDLNHASLEALRTLPVPPEIIQQIHFYRTYVRYFDNVYDLMEVEGMTAELFVQLKPLVSTLPPEPEDASVARLWASYRQVQRFLGQEGSNEGLVDEYLDQLRDPVNVNELDLFDLQSYQNVSPVDATNLLKARERLGSFDSSYQLRRAQGLRYWAYRNLRDYVVYSDEERQEVSADRVTGSYEVRYYDTPYMGDDEDILNEANYALIPLDFDMNPPHLTNKLRLDLTGGAKAGALTHRNMGEESWHETMKAYVSVQNKDLGNFHLKRLVLGSFRIAFGQGLVMDNTDFVLYRKTGYGWNKRPVGLRGDLSRSHEFALTGGALEGRIGRLHTTMFYAKGLKDGILNNDGTVNQYVLMYPRPPEGDLLGRGIQRDAFEEEMVGGNLKFMLAPGSFVGVSGYEARYDRGFRADVSTLVEASDKLDARDSEIYTGYTSAFLTPEGTLEQHKYRRVFGAEFQAVHENVSLQGEYAWLHDPRASFLQGDLGDAYIFNGYAQWDDLHVLAIYRDFDLGFDNPYNRAFGNDTRYEQTLLDAPYYMNDELYSWLSFNTPQPKPEKGLFIDTRYRISRNLILTGLQYDQWERKADGTDMRRYTLKGEYQPIWNLRLRLRQRFSSRSETMPEDVRAFKSWETRWELHALLSNYNRLKFMYMTSNVFFPPRQRLSATAEPGVDTFSAFGTAAMPAHAFQVAYEHHLSPWIRLLVSTQLYDGFLWNFEGNEFVLLDGTGFRNWLKVESRVSEHLLVQLKVTRDHNLPRSYVDLRRYNDTESLEPDGTHVPKDWTTFRLQIDYTF